MILIYDIKVIQVIFFTSPLFFQTHAEGMKKIAGMVHIFYFSMQPIFHLEKKD